MSAPYPSGGTPPTHFDITPIHEQVLAHTGADLTLLWVALTVVGVGCVLWAIAFAWRK